MVASKFNVFIHVSELNRCYMLRKREKKQT